MRWQIATQLSHEGFTAAYKIPVLSLHFGHFLVEVRLVYWVHISNIMLNAKWYLKSYRIFPVVFDIGYSNNSIDIAECLSFLYKCSLVIDNIFAIINIHVC